MGMRIDSIADLPAGLREQAAGKIIETQKKKQPKYHNQQVLVQGVKFDSKKEGRRFEILLSAMELGLIRDIRLQQDYTLQEGYTTIDGERIRAIRYKADFVYTMDEDALGALTDPDTQWRIPAEDLAYWRTLAPGETVVEDTKSPGTRTAVYKLKRKLMQERYGICIREV